MSEKKPDDLIHLFSCLEMVIPPTDVSNRTSNAPFPFVPLALATLLDAVISSGKSLTIALPGLPLGEIVRSEKEAEKSRGRVKSISPADVFRSIS